MSDKRRWEAVDYLRGMAILMVLLYHSIIVYPLNLHEIPWCRGLHSFLWVVQMPLFFLVSGFCYSCRGGYGAYFRRKCRRILIPHVVFALVEIAPRVIPNPFVNEQMVLSTALKDFVLYGGSDWFLWTLFVISALFPLLAKLLARRVTGVFAVLLVVALFFLGKEDVTDVFLLNMVSQYLLYYMLGYVWRMKAERRAAARKGEGQQKRGAVFGGRGGEDGGRLAVICLMCAALSVAAFAGYEGSGGNRMLELLCALAAFFCCYGLCCLLEKGKAGRWKAFLRLCGTYSLQMYLLDAYALVLTRTLLVSVFHVTSAWMVVSFNFVADTCLVLAASCFLLTKVKVLRILSGIPEKG